MKQAFYILILSALSLSVSAQFSVESTGTVGDAGSSKIPLYFTVTNTSDVTQQFFWDIDRPAGIPADWDFSICDTNTCYDWGRETSPCNEPSVLAAGASATFTLNTNPNGLSGNHAVNFRILSDCDAASSAIIAKTQTFDVTAPENVTAPQKSDILIYPNPTFNSFQVTDDSNIKSLSIYNVVGSEMMTLRHTKGKYHDVSKLDKGIYLVRMIDNDNDVVKVIRMTKK